MGVLGKTAVLLLIIILAAIGWIMTGRSDPQVVGELVWQKELFTLRSLSGMREVVWLDEELPEGAFSVRLTAVYNDSNPDSQYGLLLGRTADPLVIAISATGFAGIEQNSVIVPYAPFLHVHPDTTNEIWLNMGAVKGGMRSVAVRLNRELFWQGDVDLLQGKIGLMVENFDEGKTAVVQFQTLMLFE